MASSDDQARAVVKVVCSYGGRILPHEHLEGHGYVGGTEVRVKMGRHISYPVLLSRLANGLSLERTADLLLKYELPGQEKTLVTVSDAGDLECMMEEYDDDATFAHAEGPTPRFRIFLDRAAESSPPPASAPTVLVICRYGARIVMPPPALIYTGGTNKVVTLGRYITYPDLIARLSDLFSLERTADLVLRYQFPGQYFLVSVVDGRDVELMMQEFDRRLTFVEAADRDPLFCLFLDRVGAERAESLPPPRADSCDAHYGDSDSGSNSDA